MKKLAYRLFITTLISISLISFSFHSVKNVYADTEWTITTVDDTTNVGWHNSIALGSDGFARISYYDATNTDLKFVRCTNADCSESNITTVDASDDNVGTYTSLKLGSDGFARISYIDETNFDLKFVQCTNADCTAKNITTVDSGNVGGSNSLALGNDGFARISYYFENDLNFVQCTNAACSEKNITTIDSTINDAGTFSSLALGNDGFARISYYDDTDGNLKFVICGDAACSETTTTIVDDEGAGPFNSLALGSDGFARISYIKPGGELVLAQCTNAACSEKNITTIDSGDAEQYNSLVLSSDELAKISYQTDVPNDLNYVTCINADCSENTITRVESSMDETPDVVTFNSLALNSDGLARISYFDDDDNELILAVETETPDPTPTPQPENNNSSSSFSSPSAPSCNDSMPNGAPDLFQLDVNNTQAKLYFAPVSNSNKYFIVYGNGEKTDVYGVEFETGASTGVISYTINALAPNSEYSFKVRGGNGCMPGEWGNTMTVKTGNKSTSGTSFYKNFASHIISFFPRQVTNAGTGSNILGTKTGVTTCQDYTVKSGDNLWNIASQKLGSGTKYSDIMQQNSLNSKHLNIGQTLKIGC